MPRYRVRTQLSHGGTVLPAGSFVELPAAIARDGAVSGFIEEVDDAGKPVAPAPVDDLEGFRSHERVGLLRDRLKAAQAVGDAIQAQLDAEETTLAAAVAAMTKPTQPAAAPAVAAVKE